MLDSVHTQILDEINHLTPEQQMLLLMFVRQLRQATLPMGTAGQTLLAARDRFTFAKGDVDAMMQAIEEGCASSPP